PRIVNLERQVRRLTRFDRPRRHIQVQVILDGIRKPRDQRHAATRALAGTVGSNIRIHRTDVNITGILRGKRRNRSLRAAGDDDDHQDHETEDRTRHFLASAFSSGSRRTVAPGGMPLITVPAGSSSGVRNKKGWAYFSL